MIAMEIQNDVVNFEYNGVKYAMTEQEIEAAYRYREHQYRLEDARRQFNTIVFGSDGESGLDDLEREQARTDFVERYGIGYYCFLHGTGSFLEALGLFFKDNPHITYDMIFEHMEV